MKAAEVKTTLSVRKPKTLHYKTFESKGNSKPQLQNTYSNEECDTSKLLKQKTNL